MLKFAIVSKDPKSTRKISDAATRLGFTRSAKPEFIISLGGDGTFLRAERKYPGIPKLLIRDSNVCQKCDNLEYDQVFMCIAGEEYRISKHMKIEAVFRKKAYTATNDFAIRNRNPTRAIRFSVGVGQDVYPLIGDGVVISSPFGSTGYFYSIARKSFKSGMGIAFNNVTTGLKSRVVNNSQEIVVELLRHDADFTVDNDPRIMTIKEGETVVFKPSKHYAQLIHLKPKKWKLPFRRHRR